MLPTFQCNIVPRLSVALAGDSEQSLTCRCDRVVKPIDTGQMHGEVKRFIKDQIRLQLTYTEGEVKSSKVQLAFRWWSVPPLNDGPRDGTQFGSSGDDLQAFIDEFNLMISNQDVIQF